MKYQRVLVKLSGEALKDEESNSILSGDKLGDIASVIKELVIKGVQVCIVVGAGNIWRGKLAESLSLDAAKADQMGMLGTIINALAICETLKNHGMKSTVFSSVEVEHMVAPFSLDKARKKLEKGEVVVFAGGTGNPFFTTDTCAALRAKEMQCDAILMGKNGVEGVYSDDPRVNKNAQLLKDLTFDEVLDRNLKVMDGTAVSLLRDSDIIIRVFSMGEPSNFVKVVEGQNIGTTIHKGE